MGWVNKGNSREMSILPAWTHQKESNRQALTRLFSVWGEKLENVNLVETGIRTRAFTTVQPKEAKGKCPNCNTSLQLKSFIDARDFEDKPSDINEDLYCPKCDIRWVQEPGPHEFYEE